MKLSADLHKVKAHADRPTMLVNWLRSFEGCVGAPTGNKVETNVNKTHVHSTCYPCRLYELPMSVERFFLGMIRKQVWLLANFVNLNPIDGDKKF